MNSNIKKILKETNYVNKEIKVDESKSSYVRWENKKIKQKINIFQPSEKSMCNIIAPKEGQLLLNKDVKFEDKESAEKAIAAIEERKKKLEELREEQKKIEEFYKGNDEAGNKRNRSKKYEGARMRPQDISK